MFGVRKIEFDILNENSDDVTLKYVTNRMGTNNNKISKQETQVKIGGNSKHRLVILQPMYTENERLSLTTDKLFDINGLGPVWNILFSKDVYAMVVLNKKRKKITAF